MKILIIGGTGAMGTHLIDILSVAPKNQIYVTTRQNKQDDRITYLQGNAKSYDFFECLIAQKWDVIIDFMIYPTTQFQHRIQRFLSATKQYIFLSSARVYANVDTVITEKSPRLLDVCEDLKYLENDEYALIKARQENILFASTKKNWTIIRPYITFSENRLQLGVLEKEDWLLRALNNKTIIFSSDIATKITTITYGYDVARGIASIINQPTALGEVFHITSPFSYHWNDIFNLYIKILEEVTGEKVKYKLLDTIACIEYCRYQVIYDRYYNRIFDNSKIGKYIDLNSFKKPLTALEECFREFLKQPKFKNINLDYKHIFDQISNDPKKLNEFKSIREFLAYYYRKIRSKINRNK